MVFVVSIFLMFSIACGGAKPAVESTAGDDTSGESTTSIEDPEAKFARQRKDTCNKMCQRLTDCSLEDAEKNVSPDELAGLKEVIPTAIADCTEQCDAGQLSPKQVIGIRACLAKPTSCDEFSKCLSTSTGAEQQ